MGSLEPEIDGAGRGERPGKGCDRMMALHSILRKLFPSPEMASYLTGQPLMREQIRDAVAYAAIPLERKRDMLLLLASGKDTAYFRRQAAEIQKALREMQRKPGEFFYLKSCRYFAAGNNRPVEEESLGPYLSWEHVLERIQEFLGYLEADEQELAWFRVEKWSPDGSGRLKNDLDYFVINTAACYFEDNTPSCPVWRDFSPNCDLYLPVPFHAGDVVTVDCRPFAPVSHMVILEVGDNQDCCCLQALYRAGEGVWDTGAVKHGYIFPNYSPDLSPLYRITAFRGQLPEEERLLERVSRYLNGDEKRGAALFYHIFQLQGGVTGEQRGVEEAEILSCIEGSSGIHLE